MFNHMYGQTAKSANLSDEETSGECGHQVLVDIIKCPMQTLGYQVVRCLEILWPFRPRYFLINVTKTIGLFEELRLKPPSTVNGDQGTTEADVNGDR